MPSPRNVLDNRQRIEPSRSARVHVRGDPDYLDQAIPFQMSVCGHAATDLCEELEVELLRREHRVPTEVRKHATHQVGEAATFPLQRLVAWISTNGAAAGNTATPGREPVSARHSD